MRRPAAILVQRTNASEHFAARKRLTWLQFAQCFAREMTIQREKFVAITGFVPQNHQWTVVEFGHVFREEIYDSFEWRTNWSARYDKQIKPQVDGSSLVSVCLVSAILRGCVK